MFKMNNKDSTLNTWKSPADANLMKKKLKAGLVLQIVMLLSHNFHFVIIIWKILFTNYNSDEKKISYEYRNCNNIDHRLSCHFSCAKNEVFRRNKLNIL